MEKLATLLDACDNKLDGEPFKLYYVVPAVLFNTFCVPACADRRVELWVMRLPLADQVKPMSYQPVRPLG